MVRNVNFYCKIILVNYKIESHLSMKKSINITFYIAYYLQKR